MTEKPRFLYVHIAKTGGVTFRQVLEDSCRANEILHAAPPERLLDENDQSLARYRLVHGHFNLAQTRHLKGFKRITTLREPTARCLSAYNFWRGLNASDGHWPPTAKDKIRAAQSCSLAEMIQHPNPSIRHTFHNMQTRLLCGENDLENSLGEQHLQLAVEELKRFDFIGLNSDLELSMQLLCHKFDLFLPARINTLNSSKHRVQPDEATLQMLRDANTLDSRLLGWANQRGLYRLNGLRGLGMLNTLKSLFR